MINLKKVHKFDVINDIQQTSKLRDLTKAKHFTNIQEIILHFKLAQRNKDGGDAQLIYCQLKIPSEAIRMLIETQGAIPNTFMHAFKDNLRQTNEIEHLKKITQDYSNVKKLIDENEQVKKLSKYKDQQITKLANERDQAKKLNNEKDQQIAKLASESDQKVEEIKKLSNEMQDLIKKVAEFEKV